MKMGEKAKRLQPPSLGQLLAIVTVVMVLLNSRNCGASVHTSALGVEASQISMSNAISIAESDEQGLEFLMDSMVGRMLVGNGSPRGTGNSLQRLTPYKCNSVSYSRCLPASNRASKAETFSIYKRHG